MSTEANEKTAEAIHDAEVDATYYGRLVTDDGEVIETPAEHLPVIRDEVPPDEGFVKWVLRKRAEAEADAVAAEAAIEDADAIVTRMETEAVAALKQNPEYVAARARCDHASKVSAKAFSRLRRLDFYTPMLRRFAELATAGKRSRTWDSPFGSISLRSKPGRLQIVDNEKAVAFASTFIPDAVETKTSVQVSKIPKDWKQQLTDRLAGGVDDDLAKQVREAFSMTPDDVAVEITTGVKVKA